MLVIRRRVGEAVLIGDGVEVQVVEVGPHRVKLGFIAPPDVTIIRREVRLVEQQNVLAALSGPDRLPDMLASLRRTEK